MSPFALLQTGCLAAFALLLLGAAWQDFRSMRIGNALSAGIVAAFAVWLVAGLLSGKLPPSQALAAIGCGLAVFAVAALGFAAGILGGGDVKLLAAASLFAGPALLLDFLLITAVVGGVLGLAMLAGAPIGPDAAIAPNGTMRGRLRRGLPYGPAIAAGGLWTAFALTSA
jgi:prepilin peptidase CpaA